MWGRGRLIPLFLERQSETRESRRAMQDRRDLEDTEAFYGSAHSIRVPYG